MYYIVYKTVNKINGKFYIGKHQTSVLEDGYMGSGINLKKAIKKYGIENFEREILYVYDNIADMERKERELITEDLIKSEQCYNIALGGQGGNLGPVVNAKIGEIMSVVLSGKPKTESHILNMKISKLNYKPSEKTVEKITTTSRRNWSEMSPDERKKKQARIGTQNGCYGKPHTEETIAKIKATIGDSRKGSKNANAKPITIHGVTYSTRKECMQSLGLNKRSFYKLLGETL
jgi:group I intron endonuclease